MTKKNLTLVLALLLIASVSMWAQTIGTISTTVTDTNQSSDQTQGHISRGCVLCHTPHASAGLIQQASAGITQAKLGVAYIGGTVPAGGAVGAAVGNPLQGNIYLWGQAISPLTYTTWDGGTLTGAGLTINSPAIHSIMCLSCHDGAVTGNSHDLITKLGGATGAVAPGAYGGTTAFAPGSGTAGSFWNGSATNNGWSYSSSLATNHPIDAKYPVSPGDPGYGLYWTVTINAANHTVSFNDTAFVPYTGGGAYPGHPARLYTDGSSAYVECTTCHEPHRETHVAYKNGSTWVVDTAVGAANPTTMDYIRGPFLSTNGEMSSGFCRSCHYDKSADYINTSGRIQ
jgi:hypothetical protein